MTAVRSCILLCVLIAAGSVLRAQELEARTFANAPVGVNFFGAVVGMSSGNVLVDRALPIEDVDARLLLVGFRYTRTLNLTGRLAKLKVFVPFSEGDWQGFVDEEYRERHVRGAADARFTFEVNVAGSPALGVREFAHYRQKTIVGVGLRAVAPTGQYDPDRLINLGSNRWAFRAEVGVSRAVGRWVVEGVGSARFFTDNDDFFGGSTLEQDPIFAVQAHGIYNFRPGFWLGVGVGYLKGGATTVDGVGRDDEQTNSRAGLQLSYPLGKRHGLSFAVSTGVTTTIGADFDRVLIGYQYAWGANL